VQINPSLQQEAMRKPDVEHSKTLYALALGVLAGLAANRLSPGSVWLAKLVRYGTNPVGQIWLRSLLMIAVPLVFASLTLGILGLGDFRKLGRVGLKLLAFILLTQTLAAIVGLFATARIRPGEGISEGLRQRLLLTYQEGSRGSENQFGHVKLGVETWSNIVPLNPIAAAASGDMLGIVVFSVLFGIGLATLPYLRTKALVEAISGLSDVMMALVDLVIRAAPIGVFALVFSVAAQFGADLVVHLGLYLVTCIGSLLFFEVVVYPILILLLAGFKPVDFFVRTRDALLTAFSTGSSNATLPTAIRVSEISLGLPATICRFVLPIGATVCKNGTSLFDAVVILFVAQAFGIHLSLTARILVVVMIVLMGLGTAGVPGATFPLMALVAGTVGVPGEGIAIVIGVDRILDMCRTTVNVTGGIIAAAYVSRFERPVQSRLS
jgi:Na+/H+-dicarboxylate symporter